MLVTLAYCQKDQDITLQLFDWIKELGGASNHVLLLAHDNRCPQNVVEAILASAKASFKDVRDIPAMAEIDGWPEGANYFFKLCAGHIEHIKGIKYFFWLEPDAIPLTSDWLDKIEAEYLKAGKPFMGDDVNVDDVPRHMSGIGVYENPIHIHAGQINWAHDMAWDMVAAPQILPNAHFTKLIEHAWKHDTFSDPHELTTQIRPEAVLFHSSKDGSLIKLLRERKNLSAAPVLAEPLSGAAGEVVGSGEARESNEIYPDKSRDSRGGTQITYDIFIRTYPADYTWLKYCLQSLHKYAQGFRKTWIVCPQDNPSSAFFDSTQIEWKVLNEETEDGYLAQQIHKLYADVITDYQADYILHIDSDTLFTKPVTPLDFFTEPLGTLDISQQKLIWYYTPYEHTQTPWKSLTQKFLGQDPPHEFMRRLPMMIPRWLYPKLREHCYHTHHMIISDYIRRQPYREFSEFNALGAYAWFFHHDKFHWVNTMEGEMPPPLARQFFSWGGITDEVQAEINTILGGSKEAATISTAEGMTLAAQPTLNGGEAIAHPHAPPLGDSPPSDNGQLELSAADHVRALVEYSERSRSHRSYVLTMLKKADLRPLRIRRKKKIK